MIPPLAIDGACVTIRRFGTRRIGVDAFAPGPRASAFLDWVVTAGWNVLVSGGTSSGKTTMLNALSGSVDSAERIVTIEETAELTLAQRHVVRLEARPPNAEGAGAVSVRDLVRTALRMRPDRLVVGEVRGAEALDLLQALNTGHDGSLSTIHANGPVDALRRLVTLTMFSGLPIPFAAIAEQVAAGVDVVVQVERGRQGDRRLVAIAEVRPPSATLETRDLFVARGDDLVVVGVPDRAARRRDVPPPDRSWFR